MDRIKRNKNLFIVALIAVVNALGYGIIIPILYSYSQRFGLTDFQNGMLFSVFSICQFISAPFIGRFSDKYGRRPLLLISILGTSISFFIMAFAQSAFMLFFARALDGITSGNITVASAIISDTTTEKNRAKGFGIIGASFGFGFVFGPAISAFTIGFSQALPFIIAGTVSFLAFLLTYIILPETNKHIGEIKESKIFDFVKMFKALGDKNIGPTLLISFFYFLSFSMYVYTFQPFALKSLKMTVSQISILFTMFGLIGIFSQAILIPTVTKYLGLKRAYSSAIFFVSIAFFIMYFVANLIQFLFVVVFFSLFNSFVSPLTQTVLSRETDPRSQGSILGLNSSYMSMGQMIGPILGGSLATLAVHYPFLAGSFFTVICFFLSLKVLKKGVRKESAF
ncbi:MAG TPA: MFS transporter [Patescibacteria group bacterium]|nr:MFS transporter [Patescibacteria group bacterium]